MKEKEELKKEIEAVLFAAGRKVSTEEIAKLCKADMKETADALRELKQDYEQKASPLLLTEESDGYKLTVREKYLSIVKEVTPHTELNRSMMETLAVIAWKQPVMQADVIKIRTSNAYDDIRNLVEMGFISKEKHGRTFILKPTGKFFEYFDLPSKEAVKEVFKDVKDVEPETQEKLDVAEGAGEEHLGKLDVYEAAEDKGEPGEEDPKERLGGLDVFAEEEKEEQEEGEEKEDTEGQEPEEEGTAEEEAGTDEERARRMIHELAEEDEDAKENKKHKEGREEQEEDKEEADEDPEESEEREASGSGDDEEKPKKKGRLPKELEEFAGIDGEEKKEEEEPEEDKE